MQNRKGNKYMEYRKIIPCVTMEDPVAEARFYNDSGADEVAFFDSTASRESLDKNIPIIKEITRNIDMTLEAFLVLRISSIPAKLTGPNFFSPSL